MAFMRQTGHLTAEIHKLVPCRKSRMGRSVMILQRWERGRGGGGGRGRKIKYSIFSLSELETGISTRFIFLFLPRLIPR